MTSINVLTICFSIILIILTGCSTTNTNKHVWVVPHQPIFKPVTIVPMSDVGIYTNGYYMTTENGINLANNVEDIKTYLKKIDIMIKTMSKYYGDQIEEQ